jgi:hypothetical protein
MRFKLLIITTIIGLMFVVGNAQTKPNDTLRSPKKGSAERQLLLDALRGSDDVNFQVHYIKVHHGWAWIDTTPLDKQGNPTAEGGPNLLHFANGAWKVMDLSKVPADKNDPMGAEDASPGFIRNLKKTFPGVATDIFPKPSR